MPLNTIKRHRFVSNDDIIAFAKHNGIMEECIEKISSVLRTEHYTDGYMPFKGQLCLNLDAVEREFARREHRNQRHSVDFVIGLEGCWILAVEAKIDVQRPRNMEVSDLRNKISYSRDIISYNNSDAHIEPSVVVLLNTKNFQQLYRELKNKVGNSLRIVPMTVGEFFEEYF